MNPYEKLIKTMREEAQNGVDSVSMGLATMTGEKSLTYNGMEFDEDDLLFADHLTTRAVKKVDFTIEDNVASPNEGYHRHPWTDKSKYISKLDEGDVVFGILIDTDDDQKFLVLCRIGG
jgi:hypothetical protein